MSVTAASTELSSPASAEDVAQALDFGEPASPDGKEAASKRAASPTTGYDFTESSMEDIFISISGIIGAGKSTLATALGGVLGTCALRGACPPPPCAQICTAAARLAPRT